MWRRVPMMVIISTDEFRYSAASSSRAWHISRALNEHGIKTVIVARRANSDGIAGENIITVKPLIGEGFVGNLLFVFQISVTVIRILANTKLKKIIARGYSLALLFSLLKLWRVEILYDFHGYAYKEQMVEGRMFRARFTRVFDWLSLKLADQIITIREELREDFPLDVQQKTILLPNGVDIEEFAFAGDSSILAKYSIPHDKKLVGFIGNWEAWITIEDILESAKYFGDEYEIVIIGRGKWFEEYKNSYTSIIFTGNISHRDAIGLLKKIDVCVCPYSTHVIAKKRQYQKVLDYLAAGKPIVISDADSREKFLKDGENVLMYRAGDPKDLAAKVKTILNNDELRKKMSRNNLELAKQFTWKKVIARSGINNILQGVA